MTPHALVKVEVAPTEAYEQRVHLFETLEATFPVRFRPPGAGNPDGTVAFVTADHEVRAMSGPTLALFDDVEATGERRFGAISFRDSGLLPRPFRGRSLVDTSTRSGVLPPTLGEWGEVLATSSEGPVWSGRPGLQFAAMSWPVELESGHALREQLTVGRFMGLLPLAHFLRQLSARTSWEPPESKACFVFDDPNLHWWSYGFFDYRRLAAHANANGYHVTAATIPLDQWYIHQATARFLRDENAPISFAIHGNNHTHHELRRVEEPAMAAVLAEQALGRAEAVRRAGLEIAPVMVPPFGVCSTAMLEGCLRAGFDALCADWPYWWLTEPGSTSALSGWEPLDRLESLPVIPRLHIVNTDFGDDIVFRAFLGQPLILYGHHTDLSSGLDLLATRADEIRSLGVDRWESLGSIAKGVVSTLRSDHHLAITLYSNSATVAIPKGVREAAFALPGADAREAGLRVEIHDARGRRQVRVGERFLVAEGQIVATLTVEPSTSTAPPRSIARGVRAAVRRLLTECRDRALPLSSKIGLRSLGPRSNSWFAVVGCLLPW